MTQPCDVLPELPAARIDPVYQPPTHPSLPAWGMWIGIGIAILVFETWAYLTGHETMTQAVRHGPAWARWFIGAGLIWLWIHLMVQK